LPRKGGPDLGSSNRPAPPRGSAAGALFPGGAAGVPTLLESIHEPVSRMGELLKQFDAQGKRTDKLDIGTDTKLSIKEVIASGAGRRMRNEPSLASGSLLVSAQPVRKTKTRPVTQRCRISLVQIQ
jgi:hypothetical protein